VREKSDLNEEEMEEMGFSQEKGGKGEGKWKEQQKWKEVEQEVWRGR
jgi:hypothetical protein